MPALSGVPLNLATILSLARLALLPLIVPLFFLPFAWAAWTCLALYVVGALTDFADGWVARRFGQVTEFGKFIDPVSDKIFVVTILLMLVATDRIAGIFVIAAVVILVREFVVSGLREFLGAKAATLPVTRLAKWKTAIQMAACGLLIIAPVDIYAELAGLSGLCVAAAITAWTGWLYLQKALPHFAESP